MKQLAEFQQQFQRALLKGDDDILSVIPDAANGEANKLRLGIYQDAYMLRLHEVLSTDYPNLHAYLGDEQFWQLCGSYLGAHPSRFTNARWVGDMLPTFLTDTLPWAERTEIFELASLEHALNKVFDEVDEPIVSLADLGAIAPDEWPQLVFRPIRASLRLGFASNAVELWSSLSEEAQPPAASTTANRQALLVYRNEEQSRFRPLADEEAMMWDEMHKGVNFGGLCEMVATFGGEDDAALRAAGYLQGWLNDELLSEMNLD